MKNSLLGSLLFAVSVIFYIIAIMALFNGYYSTMFFLMIDGILFGAAGYFIKYHFAASSTKKSSDSSQ